jgi:hypothetical protein
MSRRRWPRSDDDDVGRVHPDRDSKRSAPGAPLPLRRGLHQRPGIDRLGGAGGRLMGRPHSTKITAQAVIAPSRRL